MTGILIGPSIPHEPLVRPLALPMAIFYIQISLQMAWSAYMTARQRPAPFRISSLAKGDPMRPLTYTIIEDVVAVDGGAGRSYRLRLAARYAASATFRRLIAELNYFWCVGALLDGVATIIAIWVIPSQEVAYGVGKPDAIPVVAALPSPSILLDLLPSPDPPG